MCLPQFPEENDYDAYLARYNGSSNACTTLTSTNYYFELSTTPTSESLDVSTESNLPRNLTLSPLYGALDRFSQFFIQPLFREASLDRELHAIESEHKTNSQSDDWRLMQLDRSLSNKKHPYSFFSAGNYQLLHDNPTNRGIDIREEFVGFYRTHYSANRMKLAVLGRESLDRLQCWVAELFSGITNRNLAELSWTMPLQTQAELGIQIFAKSVMDQEMLTVSFPYPDERQLYTSRPGRYISHLIRHEGPGSILAYLKSQEWANSLDAGVLLVCPGASRFLIRVQLTAKGFKEYARVILVIFQYIAMLKNQPPCRWIFEEQSTLAEMRFRFKQKMPASQTVSNLSVVMQSPLPRACLLSGQVLVREFDPENIRRGLGALNPDNFRFMIASREPPRSCDLKEQWYGTEYWYEKIPVDLMMQIKATFDNAETRPSELHLPLKNEFVPTRLDVQRQEVLRPATEPCLLRHDENLRLWYKKDDCFWVPKANIEVLLRSPLINTTPFRVAIVEVFTELIDESLEGESYNARVAGLYYSICGLRDGLHLSIGGYSDKMPVLLNKVLFSIRHLEFSQVRFDTVKDRLLQLLSNLDYQEPYRQVASYRAWLSGQKSWANQQLLAGLSAVSAEYVRSFVPQMLGQLHIEVLVHGDLSREDALRSAHMIEAALKPKPFPPSQWEPSRRFEFPPGADFLYRRVLRDPSNVNQCLEYTIQVGDSQDSSLQARLLLFSQVVQEPLFDTLRTKEQLGYICSGSPVWNGTQASYRILVQSERDCEYLESRVDVFLSGLEELVTAMPQPEFDAHKTSAVNKRTQKPRTLDQETTRLWHHISNGTYDFEIGKSALLRG